MHIGDEINQFSYRKWKSIAHASLNRKKDYHLSTQLHYSYLARQTQTIRL